jgi:hypothetical protein
MSQAQQLHNRRYFDDYLESINRQGLFGNVKIESHAHLCGDRINHLFLMC